jgi:hypothetical protein
VERVGRVSVYRVTRVIPHALTVVAATDVRHLPYDCLPPIDRTASWGDRPSLLSGAGCVGACIPRKVRKTGNGVAYTIEVAWLHQHHPPPHA